MSVGRGQPRSPVLVLAILVAIGIDVDLRAAEPSTKLDFTRDIQPIFKASCYNCHGAAKQKGKLRLDSRDLARQGGKSGKAILPGDSAQSLLVKRLLETDDTDRMPQDREALPKEQIALIRAWIDQGASWPAGASAADAKIEKHWAFVRPTRTEPPAPRTAAWARNPIDRFILARLEKASLAPAAEASKETLIRRVSLDLIGLPPTPEEIDAFVADESSDAFEKVVDRLLASPRYGERWARHWLDLARYAESEGFKADETRPNAWRYRDYVINSFNADKPYDRFIREQIAGDELWPADPDAHIATAFNRHYPDESNARNLLQRRQEILNDITDTVGAVFTGLTIACARCHNHKYDDISQADYYRLQAFFANIRAADEMVLASPQAVKEYQTKLAVWEEKTRDIRAKMNAIEEPKRNAIIKDYVDKYPAEIQASLNMPAAKRSAMDWQMYHKASQYLDPKSYQYLAPTSAVVAGLNAGAHKRWDELKKQLDQFASLHPGELPVGTCIIDAGREAPATHVLRKGVYDAPKQEVQPGFLSAIDPEPAHITPPPGIESTGRRTALANWLANPDNPLTTRVMVNRVWQYHFGRGIVGTSSDFGVQGDRPTHPELLDWLAAEFVHDGWSIKKLHRLIVTSATYRQASSPNSAARSIDPEDKLLWSFPRRRLEGEVIRDSALATSGLLNLKMAGPSIFPELPPGMTSRGGWKLTNDPAERNRRSIYVFVRRNTRYPMFEAFDMPDTHESCSRRYNTTTAVQALTLLNSRLTLEWAQGLAGRVVNFASGDREVQIDTAYRLAYGRHPTDAEKQLVRSFLDRQRDVIAQRLGAGENPALPAGTSQHVEPAEAAALVDFCHVLINSSEFVYSN
jgi:hypothetical protein